MTPPQASKRRKKTISKRSFAQWSINGCARKVSQIFTFASFLIAVQLISNVTRALVSTQSVDAIVFATMIFQFAFVELFYECCRKTSLLYGSIRYKFDKHFVCCWSDSRVDMNQLCALCLTSFMFVHLHIELTAYLVELCNRKIHQLDENQGCHHPGPPHNHTRNCHDFPLQMIGISMPLGNHPERLYAKCIPYWANTPTDSLAIQVDYHFLLLNLHRIQLSRREWKSSK